MHMGITFFFKVFGEKYVVVCLYYVCMNVCVYGIKGEWFIKNIKYIYNNNLHRSQIELFYVRMIENKLDKLYKFCSVFLNSFCKHYLIFN